MFGFSGTELVLIILVCLLVIHPKDLPATLRSIRNTLGKLKQTANEFTNAIMGEEDLRSLSKEATQLNNDIKHIIDLNGDLQPTYPLDDLKTPTPKKQEVTKE